MHWMKFYIELCSFYFWPTNNRHEFAKVKYLPHDVCLWQCMIYVYTVHRPKLVQLQWFDLKRAFNIYSRFLKINPNITILSHFESIVSLIWVNWVGLLFDIFVLSLFPILGCTLLLWHKDLDQSVQLHRQPNVVLSSDVVLQGVLPAVHVPAEGTTELDLESAVVFIKISCNAQSAHSRTIRIFKTIMWQIATGKVHWTITSSGR